MCAGQKMFVDKSPTQTTNHKRILYLLKSDSVFCLLFSPQMIFTYRAVIFGHLKKRSQCSNAVSKKSTRVWAGAVYTLFNACVGRLDRNSIDITNGWDVCTSPFMPSLSFRLALRSIYLLFIQFENFFDVPHPTIHNILQLFFAAFLDRFDYWLNCNFFFVIFVTDILLALCIVCGEQFELNHSVREIPGRKQMRKKWTN